MRLDKAELVDLGSARKITVSKDSTIIVEGTGNPEEAKKRVEQLKTQIDGTTSNFDLEKLQERLARLAGGVAVLNVGASTEVEMRERKARVDDAMHATRAAVEEGIVPGGGVALLECLPAVKALELEGDEAVGAAIVRRALEEPLRRIATNAGQDGSVVLARVLALPDWQGYDAEGDRYVDLLAVGIIDPKKVVRCALQNAASVAGLMLTTEGLCADIPEKEPQNMGPGGPGGPYAM